MNRVAFLAARFVFVFFWLATASYCIIAFIPFTYVEVIQFDVVPALNVFARLHPYLYWVALGTALLTMREDFRRSATRRPVILFFSVSAAAGIALLFHPLLSTLENDESALLLGFVALVPLVGVALIDIRGCAGRIDWSQPAAGEDRRLFRATFMTAVFLAAVYFAIFLVRFGGGASTGLSARASILAGVFSLAAHLTIFMGAFSVFCVVRSFAAMVQPAARAEFWLTALVAVAGLAAVLRNLVLNSVSLSGQPAIAMAFALAIVVSHVGLSLRLFSASGRLATCGIGVFFASLAWDRAASLWLRVLGFAALAALAFVCVSSTAVMDWNFLLQKLGALVFWILAFAGFLAVAPLAPRRPRTTAWYLAISVVVLAGFKGISAWEGGNAGLDRYAGRDPSFKILRDLLRRPQGAASRDDSAYYRYLQERTNLPRSVRIDPVDVRFVPTLTASPGPKPNIFIFVIDSLRRDYLSPYNPRVSFTPAIGEFAADSVVFTNAFTRYGGSGLAEPSIWVGGMLPHQQYVTPFHPLNALEKLLEAESYRSFVSIDTILRVILKPDPKTVEIDQRVLTRDLRLPRSLADLVSRLRKGEAEGLPVFAYAQPQDIHVSTIAREGGSVPEGESYSGFYAPYASRLARADAGFGEFVRALRDLGIYDDSIIVLTSDHGDSLGEDGRWGHAYTIFPEVLRVPLIVHLPKAMRAKVAWNPSGLTFLTDITPTLYSLLGHEPELRNDVFGRSLFEARSSELPAAARAAGNFVVASSYGPVYGILGDNGGTLYIADSVNYTEYLYDLTGDPAAPPIPLSEEKRATYRALVRESLDSIHVFYGVP